MSRAGRGALAATIVLSVACSGDTDFIAPLYIPPEPPVPLAQVSDRTDFTRNCDQQSSPGTNYKSSEVEPSLAINPTDADNFVGTWQQDRWSNGGARGLLVGVTFDGGATWETREAPFSRCTGGTLANDGDYARATDPWITFGPDGVAYWMAMTITDTQTENISGMMVSRSTDGGDTWEAPVVLIDSTNPYFNDKNAITADPTDANYVYAVWDQLDSATNTGPAMFTRTDDGGDTWETPREIYDPGFGAQTVGNLVAVLPDGTVLNLYTEIHFQSAQPDGAALRVLRSVDKGTTWLPPVTIADLMAVGTYDEETGANVRTGGILGSIAVGPGALDVWVTWQDARFNPGATRDSIVLAHSDDGGLTWGAPVLISPPQVQAFTPTVAVAADGTLGITYYDFRDDADEGYVLTSYWLATSDDGVNWTERRVSGPFDLSIAPDALGLFLGDYEGLGTSGNNFVPFFAQTNPSLSNRTNIYSVTLPTVAPAAAKAQASFRALAGPLPQMTVEGWERVRSNVERQRKHFPDNTRPWFLPQYLRSYN